MAYEVQLPDRYLVSDEPARLDIDMLHRFLSEDSYWASGRTRATTERSLANSLCFGLYAPDGAQVGFARVLSDRATRAHLDDVFVLPAHRGRKLGEGLVAAVLGHPELETVTRWTLLTRGAHAFYARFGFVPIPNPEVHMARVVSPPSGRRED